MLGEGEGLGGSFGNTPRQNSYKEMSPSFDKLQETGVEAMLCHWWAGTHLLRRLIRMSASCLLFKLKPHVRALRPDLGPLCAFTPLPTWCLTKSPFSADNSPLMPWFVAGWG